MVRILAVADTVDRTLYEHYNASRWQTVGVELIVSCGDLKPSYLDYLVSVFNVPCFYVRGNHDTMYEETPPSGCVNLHDRVETFNGVRFFGLEGSRWYNGGPAQYTERQMWWKAFWARWTLRQSGGVDVMMAHSAPRMCPLPEKRCLCIDPPAGTPPANLGQSCYVEPERRNWEMADLPHRGFETLRSLILKYQPRFFLHGHTHLGYGARPREMQIGRTRVIDVYGHVVLDV
ncbi:MAG: metallophosphoesterase family protein [Chloroflexi bacterium]|nr:metallophosphoesterase family protein [Chloroflexota bacterium]